MMSLWLYHLMVCIRMDIQWSENIKKKINIKKNNFLKKELIKPTKIYVNDVLSL